MNQKFESEPAAMRQPSSKRDTFTDEEEEDMPATTMRPRPLDMTDAQFARWLAAEGKSIGGSDIGAVVGVNPYKDAADLWDELVGAVPRSQADNPNMARGRALEPVVADQYAHQTGRDVSTATSLRFGTYYRVSVDRMLLDAQRQGPGVLEIKVPRAANYRQMRLLGVDPMYQAQLTWYMGHLQCQWGAFAIFNADEWALFHHDVELNTQRFAELVEAADTFWHDNVLARVRPSTDSREALAVNIPRTGGEAVDVSGDSQWAAIFQRIGAAREALNLAQHQYDMAKDDAQALMGAAGADVVTREGSTIYWNEVTRRTLDTKRLAAAHPELDLEPYYKSTVSRPFRPFLRGEE